MYKNLETEILKNVDIENEHKIFYCCITVDSCLEEIPKIRIKIIIYILWKVKKMTVDEITFILIINDRTLTIVNIDLRSNQIAKFK